MKSKDIGNLGENFVVQYLIKNKYSIIKTNYTIRGGEVDIIAENDDIIAFVEVKTRKAEDCNMAFDAVDERKKLRIIKTAQHYFVSNACDKQPRFDIAVVLTENNMPAKIRYIENAYDMSDTNIFF